MKTRRLLILTLLAIVTMIGVLPAAADGAAFWTGEYFNNTLFAAPAVLTRTDTGIAFNWGAGSPGAGVNSDNFTVRWTTSVFLNQGTYRFWAMADDNIRVSVDYQPVIDSFSGGAVGQTMSRDVYMSFGIHQITVEYRELGGNAYAYVTWADLATNPTGPNFPVIGAPPAAPPANTTQWLVQYYNNPNLSGQPISIQSDTNPTHNWGLGAPAVGVPADGFSARWTGQVSVTGGPYRLSVRADDGVRVYINGVLVINEWHGASGLTYTADLNLPGGQHNIVIEYYDATAEAYLSYALDPLIGGAPATTVPPPPGAPGYTGGWLAYYFNNTTLTDTPAAIQTELSPSHNWGAGAPLPNVNADNFSARWTSVQQFAAGRYRVSVRADDGVRVYVDGVLVINEWHSASGQTYTYDVNLTAGPHTINIEYYEASGNAFLDYALGPATALAPTPTPLPSGVEQPRDTGATATVGLYRLNVRSQPTTNGTVIAKINPGETYTIMGRTDDRSWWQISVNGQLGWVFGNYVNTFNTGSVPITYRTGGTQTVNTGYTVTATTNVIIRSGPGTSFALLGNLPSGRTADVVGRNTRSTWYQINYNGVVGWVIASAVTLQGGANTSPIPVTG